jgi:hypothetical protein
VDREADEDKSVAILVYTVASVTFQLPATIAVRIIGPRWMFAIVTVAFGIITMVGFPKLRELVGKIFMKYL